MLLKSRNICYLFDLDGTILRESKFKGVIRHNINLVRSELLINPRKLDIPWSILTARPKMDYPFIKLACLYNSLVPDKIIVCDSLTWKFKNKEEIFHFKKKKIEEVSNGLIDGVKKDKVFYIDNDAEIIQGLNSFNFEDISFIAVTVNDIVSGKIENYI